MKLKFLIFTVLSFVFGFSYSQKLSENAEISIITCAPGDDLYAAFGHSAVRIKDAENRIDYVYNYGTFNFNTPNFYLKFARGKLNYMLNVVPYRYFIYPYVNEERWVKEQTLNLSSLQKQTVFDFLENNARSENKYYQYDFFFDNCATRVKDVFKHSLKDDFIISKIDTALTFRDAIRLYLDNREWGRFGINLALGLPIDHKVNNEEITFLPDFLMKMFENTKVIIDGQEQPIVKESRFIFKPKKIKEFHSLFITPSILLWTLFFIGFLLTAFEFWQKKYFVWFDKVLFFVTGTAGFVLLVLWFFTDHQTAVNNFNILWLIPLHLPAAFFMSKSKLAGIMKKYFLITALIVLTTVVLRSIIPQTYDIAILPFSLLLIIRSAVFSFQSAVGSLQ